MKWDNRVLASGTGHDWSDPTPGSETNLKVLFLLEVAKGLASLVFLLHRPPGPKEPPHPADDLETATEDEVKPLDSRRRLAANLAIASMVLCAGLATCSVLVWLFSPLTAAAGIAAVLLTPRLPPPLTVPATSEPAEFDPVRPPALAAIAAERHLTRAREAVSVATEVLDIGDTVIYAVEELTRAAAEVSEEVVASNGRCESAIGSSLSSLSILEDSVQAIGEADAAFLEIRSATSDMSEARPQPTSPSAPAGNSPHRKRQFGRVAAQFGGIFLRIA